MTNPLIILDTPQLGENIGAAARVMLNFGLTDLRLITPRDGWPNKKAVTMSSGAEMVLEQAGVFPTFPEGVADIQYLMAVTLRHRDMAKHVYTPWEAMAEIRQKMAEGAKCALLFGPERTGLTNDRLTLADSVLTIPINHEFGSINLAQAVAICCYEWFRTGVSQAIPQRPQEWATKQEIYEMFQHLETELERADFFKARDMKERMIQNIRNMFLRSSLTSQEVRTLRGIIRALAEKALLK